MFAYYGVLGRACFLPVKYSREYKWTLRPNGGSAIFWISCSFERTSKRMRYRYNGGLYLRNMKLVL